MRRAIISAKIETVKLSGLMLAHAAVNQALIDLYPNYRWRVEAPPDYVAGESDPEYLTITCSIGDVDAQLDFNLSNSSVDNWPVWGHVLINQLCDLVRFGA